MSDILNLPRPAWMTEDVALLDETARRFIVAEYAPHLEKWHEDHFYPREVWTKAGAAALLCASMPEDYGGAGGTFAHEAVIDWQFALAGFDTFGAPLHSGIVAPYILHYGTEEQKKRCLRSLVMPALNVTISLLAGEASLPARSVKAEREWQRQLNAHCTIANVLDHTCHAAKRAIGCKGYSPARSALADALARRSFSPDYAVRI
jgi:acyl-CoA dehydrogenase